ncbi:MAG: hypothetical protein JWP75_213 [Frondihabitans sp.]|nr:hypothetical protein [Frondihabitans sp.]
MAEHIDVARARAFVEAGRPQEGLRILRGVLASEPDRSDALLLFASTHLDHGDPGEALTAAQRALSIGSSTGRALQMLARAHSKMGHHHQAQAAATQSIAVDPNNSNSHITRVVIGLATGDIGPEVKSAANQAVALAPQVSNSYVVLGDYFRQAEDVSRSRAAYLEALRLDPQSVTARNNLGILDISKTQMRAVRTVNTFVRLLAQAPDNPLYRRNLIATILAACRHVRLFFVLLSWTRLVVSVVLVISFGTGEQLPRAALGPVSIIGSLVTLVAVGSYGGAFLVAGGPATRTFLKTALHDNSGLRPVSRAMGLEVLAVVASAFIGSWIFLDVVFFVAIYVLIRFQFRAEKRWAVKTGLSLSASTTGVKMSSRNGRAPRIPS